MEYNITLGPLRKKERYLAFLFFPLFFNGMYTRSINSYIFLFFLRMKKGASVFEFHEFIEQNILFWFHVVYCFVLSPFPFFCRVVL